MLADIFMVVLAASFGLIAAGGVFTVFISVGLIPRFEGKTHTGADYKIYETMVNLGTIGGCIFTVFYRQCEIGIWIGKHATSLETMWGVIARVLLILFGFFAGIFEGCFAIAIAEMLNSIPIFLRRVGFRHGLGMAILAIAFGKLAGSLFYFAEQIYLHGGT